MSIKQHIVDHEILGVDASGGGTTAATSVTVSGTYSNIPDTPGTLEETVASIDTRLNSVAANSFANITTNSGLDTIADEPADTLTLIGVDGIVTISTPSTDSIDISGAALLSLSGSRAMSGSLDMGGFNITNTDTITINGYIQRTPSVLTYSATTDINFASASVQTVALTGNVTFTSSNLAAGRQVTVRLVGDGSARTLTFPAWRFVGTEPTELAASKIGLLSLLAFDNSDTSVVAAYAAEE